MDSYNSTDQLSAFDLRTVIYESSMPNGIVQSESIEESMRKFLAPSDQNQTVIDEFNDISDLSPTLLLVFTVILICLLIIGVVGNILVLAVLMRTQWQERRNLMLTSSTTNAYILNLSAADLLFLVFCAPFHGTVYLVNHWPFGLFFCKFAHYCQYTTVYASIWILTTMSVDRYLAIGHPLKSVKWRNPTQATKFSIIMWISAAFVSVPWLILYETDEHEIGDGKTRVACYDAWSDSTYDYRKWMILFGFLIGFMIPSVIIFCMALLIAKSMRISTHQPLLSHLDSGQSGGSPLRKRKRVGWLVFALSSLFFICWCPHNLSLMWLNFHPYALDWISEHYQAFFILKLIAHMMTYLNSSINPLLYSVGSNQFFRRLTWTCGFRSRSSSAHGYASCRTYARTHMDTIKCPVSRSSSLSVASVKTTAKASLSLQITKHPYSDKYPRSSSACTLYTDQRRTLPLIIRRLDEIRRNQHANNVIL